MHLIIFYKTNTIYLFKCMSGERKKTARLLRDQYDLCRTHITHSLLFYGSLQIPLVSLIFFLLSRYVPIAAKRSIWHQFCILTTDDRRKTSRLGDFQVAVYLQRLIQFTWNGATSDCIKWSASFLFFSQDDSMWIFSNSRIILYFWIFYLVCVERSEWESSTLEE